MKAVEKAPPKARRRATTGAQLTSRVGESDTAALHIAGSMGLLDGPKAKHLNAKVPPKLFQAAAEKAGTNSPAAVIEAALAALATQDELGRWLVSRWGSLADVGPELLDQISL